MKAWWPKSVITTPTPQDVGMTDVLHADQLVEGQQSLAQLSTTSAHSLESFVASIVAATR